METVRTIMICFNDTKTFYKTFQNTNLRFNLVGYEFEFDVCILRLTHYCQSKGTQNQYSYEQLYSTSQLYLW